MFYIKHLIFDDSFDFFSSVRHQKGEKFFEYVMRETHQSITFFPIVCKWTNEISVFRSFKHESVKRRFSCRIIRFKVEQMERVFNSSLRQCWRRENSVDRKSWNNRINSGHDQEYWDERQLKLLSYSRFNHTPW